MYFVLRTEAFAKLFFLMSCTGLFLYAILAFYTFHTAYTTINEVQKPRELTINIPSVDLPDTNEIEWDTDLKYILFWTQLDGPAINIPEGQNVFTDHRCDYANCFITTNKTLLKTDYTNFDAIVFNISAIKKWKKLNMPLRRSHKQKYVFYSLESSHDIPVCNINADNYFNWTWTYKLNSDIVSPFIEVTDLQGNIIAPKLNVNWSSNKSIVMDDEFTTKSKPKRKAIAIFIDKCEFKNKKNLGFLKELQGEFKMNLLDFDIYGCDNLNCSSEDCAQEISKYYFYLMYEEDVPEDYVTKEILKAFKHGAVPVIVRGPDYRKFLPKGSYIKAQSMSPDHIAIKIAYIIRNPFKYYSHFNWKKRYSIHETEEFRGICDLCANLNDEIKFKSFSVYKNFRKWWHPGSLYKKCMPKGAEHLDEVLAYINNTDNTK